MIGALIGWALGATGAAIWFARAQSRCHRYASERGDPTTEAGRAYDDMATVIALDGRP